MQGFVVRANIERFRQRLATADPEQREMIARLLEEEIAKLPPQEQENVRGSHRQPWSSGS